jgi:hypothetical protein
VRTSPVIPDTKSAHLYTEGDERKLMLALLGDDDTFVKIDDAWLFAERKPLR